jgi:hypothetical protein
MWKKWWLTYFSTLKECYKLFIIVECWWFDGFFSSFFFIPFTWWFFSLSVNFPTKLIRIDFLVWNDNVFVFPSNVLFYWVEFFKHMVTLFFKKRKHEKRKNWSCWIFIEKWMNEYIYKFDWSYKKYRKMPKF